MNIELKEISESDFESLTRPILFKDELLNRRFGLITNGKLEFGLGWNSDLIKPLLIELRSGVCSVGIDQKFSIIDFNQDLVPLSFNLFYNFITSIVYKENIFVATELEVIKFNVITFEKVAEYSLPDLFEDFELDINYTLVAKCVEGEIVSL